MSWRVLNRTKAGTWLSSKAIYDREKALELFFSLRENIDDDIMLVKEERFSSGVELMEINSSEQSAEGES